MPSKITKNQRRLLQMGIMAYWPICPDPPDIQQIIFEKHRLTDDYRALRQRYWDQAGQMSTDDMNGLQRTSEIRALNGFHITKSAYPKIRIPDIEKHLTRYLIIMRRNTPSELLEMYNIKPLRNHLATSSRKNCNATTHTTTANQIQHIQEHIQVTGQDIKKNKQTMSCNSPRSRSRITQEMVKNISEASTCNQLRSISQIQISLPCHSGAREEDREPMTSSATSTHRSAPENRRDLPIKT